MVLLLRETTFHFSHKPPRTTIRTTRKIILPNNARLIVVAKKAVEILVNITHHHPTNLVPTHPDNTNDRQPLHLPHTSITAHPAVVATKEAVEVLVHPHTITVQVLILVLLMLVEMKVAAVLLGSEATLIKGLLPHNLLTTTTRGPQLELRRQEVDTLRHQDLPVIRSVDPAQGGHHHPTPQELPLTAVDQLLEAVVLGAAASLLQTRTSPRDPAHTMATLIWATVVTFLLTLPPVRRKNISQEVKGQVTAQALQAGDQDHKVLGDSTK